MKLPPVILASASPRRAELLRQLGIEFKVMPAEASEILHEQLTAGEAAQLNAYRKARSVAKKYPDALVIGADTLVYIDTVLFGKPANLEAAYLMLERLQGRTHQVVTAVCLLNLRNHRQRIFADTTTVTFKPLDAVKIRRYLSKVDPLDKAGAYAIQEQGDMVVEKFSGSFSNVVGLPLERLRTELKAWAGTGEPWNSILAVIAEGSRHLRPGAGSQPSQLLP
jgi:septum formation protein